MSCCKIWANRIWK